MNNKITFAERTELAAFLVVIDVIDRKEADTPVNLGLAKDFIIRMLRREEVKEYHFSAIIEAIFWFISKNLHEQTFTSLLGNKIEICGALLVSAGQKIRAIKTEYFNDNEAVSAYH